jgi:hypothetical protein
MGGAVVVPGNNFQALKNFLEKKKKKKKKATLKQTYTYI